MVRPAPRTSLPRARPRRSQARPRFTGRAADVPALGGRQDLRPVDQGHKCPLIGTALCLLRAADQLYRVDALLRYLVDEVLCGREAAIAEKTAATPVQNFLCALYERLPEESARANACNSEVAPHRPPVHSSTILTPPPC